MSKASRERRLSSAPAGAGAPEPDTSDAKTCAVCATEHPSDAVTCLACGEASWLPDEAA